MSNSLISRVMGTKATINEDDVVPVPGGALPARSYRDRLAQLRKRRGEDEDGNLTELDSAVESVIGEAKGDVIPDDAEELDQTKLPGSVNTRLNPIKDVVEEPARPKDPEEAFISPKSALTAPDATPDSMTPSDPSRLPGVETSKFTAPEAEAPPEAPEATPEAPGEGTDHATRTMDLLLGRRRVGGAAKKAEDFAATGAVTTEAMGTPVASEAQALAMLGMGKGGDALLAQGQEMPAHEPRDPKAIYESARRWM